MLLYVEKSVEQDQGRSEMELMSTNPRPFFTNIPKNVLCHILQDFVNFKVTLLLNGLTSWFVHSEVLSLTKIENFEIRSRTFIRMVSENGPSCSIK